MCVERADELEKLSNTRERLGDYLATVCRPFESELSATWIQ
jgi:hypothetical protein